MRCAMSECARMLALCLAVVLPLSWGAPGTSRTCYNYCNNKNSEVSEPINGIVHMECNCADFLDTEIGNTDYSSITLDDTGIYFVPAADLHFIQDHFDFQPFYISNPAKLIPKTKNRNNREYESSKVLIDEPLPSQSAHVEIYKKTETISHTIIDQESDKSPFYLDLDILDSTETSRAAVQKHAIIEDFDKTEDSLVKCLDFQVVHYTRKYGEIKEFQDFWEVRNLDKYKNWSDLDLENNIQTWCSKPTAIVQQSLHEIRHSLPKKVAGSTSVHRIKDDVTKINNTNATTTTELIQPEITTYPFDPTYNSIEKWTSINTTPSSTINKDQTITTTDNISTVDDLNNTKSMVYVSTEVTTKGPENDLDTMASQFILHTIAPALTEIKTIGDSHIFANRTSLGTTLTTPLNTELLSRTETSMTISDLNSFLGQSLNENNSSFYDTPQNTVTDGYSERKAYEEKELRIPKIITKECANNTVQTIIDGIEQLPNNDFRNNESVITGRLYFVSNKEPVPIRFFQTNNGAISLGMDGLELCNRLISKSENKSHILTTLCKFIQGDM